MAQITFFDINVSQADLALLSGSNWLNGTIIAFQFARLQQKSPPQHNNILIDPSVLSFIFFQLDVNDPDERKDFTGPNGVLANKENATLFLPINSEMRAGNCLRVNGGAHWSLAKLSIASGKLLFVDHYDSHAGSGNELALVDVCNKICKILGCETVPKIAKISVPQQQNGYDCGVFTLMFAEKLVNGGSHLECTQEVVEGTKNEIRADILRRFSSL
ncbi:hypothetical protein ScalyP_jg7940 [Parmales sp. scaly parma]|nr:hypothetical protein ScalyP_jg7940 [Parmales sp. scaly parma]